MSRWITAEEIGRRYAPKQRILVAGIRSPLGPQKPKRIKRPRNYIFAQIYLPRLECIPEDLPQHRLLDLTEWQDRDFAQEMADNYALCNPRELPTFFEPPKPAWPLTGAGEITMKTKLIALLLLAATPAALPASPQPNPVRTQFIVIDYTPHPPRCWLEWRELWRRWWW